MQNVALERAGSVERVDHRSHQRQGIEQEATVHMGPSATAMERAYVKNFSADKFWFSIDGKVHNGKALKKAIPLGTFFEFAKEGLTRDTWKHLENEGKAKSLIRTVPDKCPNKELYAEFVLLRLVEVCEVAQTTKKGWTDKGWAQCRFELVPMFGSHLREGERDELVLAQIDLQNDLASEKERNITLAEIIIDKERNEQSTNKQGTTQTNNEQIMNKQ